MFEQALIQEARGRSRVATLSISLTLQCALLGSALLVPLIWHQRLSLEPPPAPPLIFRARPPVAVKIVEVQKYAAASSAPASSLSFPRRVFQGLSRVTDLSVILRDPGPTTQIAPSDEGVGSGPVIPGWIGPSGNERGIPAAVAQPPVRRAPAQHTAPAKPVPVRVSEGVQEAKLLRRVIPVYPPLAKQMRVSGTVRLISVIATDGTIQNLRVLEGHPLLVQAALDAVKQWIYKPTLLNGEAVEVIAPIEVNFRLQ